MYLMHKYWARKPHNVVGEYIKNYSKEGDIVLDPFVGSGVTALEALKYNRKAIAIDLDPISTFITKNTAKPIDLNKIKTVFEDLKSKCKKQISELYKTKCKKCKNNAYILASVWDRNTNDIKEIRYYCFNCKKKDIKKPDDDDTKLVRRIEKMNIPYWYPKNEFPEGITFNQGRREAGHHFYNLFTKRNLYCISLLWDEIKRINNNELKEIMSFAFTSMVHLASKMCPVAKPGGKGHWSKFSATSFWAMNSYWVPPEFMESNVWMLFRSAVESKQGILRGKNDSNNQIKNYKEALKKSRKASERIHNKFTWKASAQRLDNILREVVNID